MDIRTRDILVAVVITCTTSTLRHIMTTLPIITHTTSSTIRNHSIVTSTSRRLPAHHPCARTAHTAHTRRTHHSSRQVHSPLDHRHRQLRIRTGRRWCRQRRLCLGLASALSERWTLRSRLPLLLLLLALRRQRIHVRSHLLFRLRRLYVMSPTRIHLRLRLMSLLWKVDLGVTVGEGRRTARRQWWMKIKGLTLSSATVCENVMLGGVKRCVLDRDRRLHRCRPQ